MNIWKKLALAAIALTTAQTASAQIYGKLNGLYALAGVVNPAVEFRLSEHSTFQTEFVYSPWESVTYKGISGPMKFGIFLNEYRYYFRKHNSGWYVGGNAGMMAFNMTKPVFHNGLHLKPTSSKGYGFMFGVCAGYEWIFAKKWILDVYAGFSYMTSYYNAYALVDGVVEGGRVYNKGEIIMTPHRSEQPEHEDPFNGSSEWLPNKIGVSVGILLFDPQKRKTR